MEKNIEENNFKTKRFSIAAMGITFIAFSLTIFITIELLPIWGLYLISFSYFIFGILLVLLPDKWIKK